MKLNVSVDLSGLEDEWGYSVDSEIKSALASEVRAAVKEWFKGQKAGFQKSLDKFGLKVIDEKIVERAVTEFLISTLPLRKS